MKNEIWSKAMHRLKFLALTAGLAVVPLSVQAQTPGAVQAQQSPAMPGPDGNFAGHRDGKMGGGKLAAFLTPEQRAAFMLKAREETHAMNPDQRKAWRKDQIQKLAGMSD